MTKESLMKLNRWGAVFAAVMASWLWVGPVAAQAPESICIMSADHSQCLNELTPILSATTESSHVIKSSRGVLAGFQVNNWGTSTGLTVMVFDAAATPVNGTVAPLKWYGIPAAPGAGQPATIAVNWAPGPMLHFLNGLVIACSSTGPTTLTLSSNCTFSAEIR